MQYHHVFSLCFVLFVGFVHINCQFEPIDPNQGITNQNCTYPNGTKLNRCYTGRCVLVGLDQSQCVDCGEGYTGNNCEKPPIVCMNSPCGEHGTCSVAIVNGVQARNCTCDAGWKGDVCEIPINECMEPAPIDCGAHGTCQDGENSWLCICDSGWSGVYCQLEVQDCSQTPCQNGGTCRTSAITNLISCECYTGWTGSRCEIKLPCEPNPCANDGLCQVVDNTYRCTCAYGFSGTTCTIPSAQTTSCTGQPMGKIVNMCDQDLIFRKSVSGRSDRNWLTFKPDENTHFLATLDSDPGKCECEIIGLDVSIWSIPGDTIISQNTCSTFLNWSRFVGLRRLTQAITSHDLCGGFVTLLSQKMQMSRDVITVDKDIDPLGSTCVMVSSRHHAIRCKRL